MKTLLALLLLIPSLSWADIFACSHKALNDTDQIINIIIEKKGNGYSTTAPRDIKLSFHEDEKSIRFVNYKELGIIYSIILSKPSLIGKISSTDTTWVNNKRIDCTRKK